MWSEGSVAADLRLSWRIGPRACLDPRERRASARFDAVTLRRAYHTRENSNSALMAFQSL
jgi:hypothetical protein